MNPASFDRFKEMKPKPPEKGDPRSKRDEMLNKFLARHIRKKDRKGDLVEVTPRELAIILSHYTVDQMHDLYSKCDAPTTENFSKLFWWHLNPKPKNGNKETNN